MSPCQQTVGDSRPSSLDMLEKRGCPVLELRHAALYYASDNQSTGVQRGELQISKLRSRQWVRRPHDTHVLNHEIFRPVSHLYLTSVPVQSTRRLHRTRQQKESSLLGLAQESIASLAPPSRH
jgi:hypothetical protein